ncbi:uncharacterized protein L969DRAFT_91371 [Mixia osmundae IAM 14324]|uniref:cyclin-dependent kinase n=1 Tax=Mixia osmundae (strain CBS 9802 / IAM 14324 / JCM 22182 / KY 12970) TaxID=764103 RepID=G7E797_MIXOS|nr:uncharacterized protein L969DRAFT_91371 [Mixia osmundae IAM 14324]KEI41899.1 hypothetical protein L969DRAFT_91371 [Mixia osmundae IAM 14324]GAA98707.1 hypothetical protein E5Q_05395 [Mixia osmundae IAM 14324]
MLRSLLDFCLGRRQAYSYSDDQAGRESLDEWVCLGDLASPTSALASVAPVRKKSKWEDLDQQEDEDDLQAAQAKALERELKKKAKRAAAAAQAARERPSNLAPTPASPQPVASTSHTLRRDDDGSEGPVRVSIKGKARATEQENLNQARLRAIRQRHPVLAGSRSVYCYERLNHIEEGSYGVVSRARDKATGEIVALKKLKMDQEKNGFPVTSLREIKTLLACSAHENIVRVREIVVGDTLTQVFIVMDFIEHDLKTLLSTMKTPFLASEIKTLMLQLLSACQMCHDNWIVHRDLKTSNLLMNNRGQIKVADFGLARTYGEPLGDMTQLVVTLWYRAPELLLGTDDYSTAVDMWSVGCIFGELILKEPLLPGKGEIDQINRILQLLGRPTEDMWPGFSKLPNAKALNLDAVQPFSKLRAIFKYTTEAGLDLLSKLLRYDPKQRITAEEALKHPYFSESPLPKHPDLFQSFPSIAGGEKKRAFASPSAPTRQADKDQFDLVHDFGGPSDRFPRADQVQVRLSQTDVNRRA